MAKSAQMVSDKWARNLGAATESIKQGVNAVTESPMEKAAARADAYAQGVQTAVAEGRFQRGLRRVSTEDWKKSVLGKGIPRIAAGANEAKPKMASFYQEFLPHVEAGQAMLRSMPRGDLQSNINRAVAMMQHNANFRRGS